MPRGYYPKRLYTIDLDEETLNQYRRQWYGKDLHFHPEKFPMITVKEFFDVDKKFAVEIGCGDGRFLCALAKREPEVCFLGIEALKKLTNLAASNAAKENLFNVRFLQADLRFIAKRFLTESVDVFYLHFPPPFESEGNLKRLTYSKEMLLHINRALKIGGRFSFITDDEMAFDYVQEEVKQIESFLIVPSTDYHFETEAELKSTYHKRWEKKGRMIHRAEFEKK